MDTRQDHRDLQLLFKALIMAQTVVTAVVMAWFLLMYPHEMHAPGAANLLSPIVRWSIIAAFINTVAIVGLIASRAWKAVSCSPRHGAA